MQEEFYDRLELIMSLETDAVGWHDAMAHAIEEIFANNEKLSLDLKPKQVEELMNLVKSCKSESPDLLHAIRSIVKCEELNVPLKRNQNIVMKSLMRNFDEIVKPCKIDVGNDPTINQERMELLRYSGQDAEKQKMQRYHANLVGLLAHCAEGYNRFIESTCATLFSLDEIFGVLQDDAIPIWIKSEYLLFFHFVYLETSASPIEMGTDALATHQPMWSAFSSLSEKLAPLFTSNEDYLNKDEDRFAFAAYLPVMAEVVKRFFTGRQKPKPTAVSAVRKIFEQVKQLASRSLKKLYYKDQVEAMTQAVADLKDTGIDGISESLFQQLRDQYEFVKHGQSEVMPQSEEYKRYKETYNSELISNENLNVFCARVKKIYVGRNEVEIQLPGCTTVATILNDKYYEDDVCFLLVVFCIHALLG